MEWLKDKKNLPIVVALAVVVFLVAGGLIALELGAVQRQRAAAPAVPPRRPAWPQATPAVLPPPPVTLGAIPAVRPAATLEATPAVRLAATLVPTPDLRPCSRPTRAIAVRPLPAGRKSPASAVARRLSTRWPARTRSRSPARTRPSLRLINGLKVAGGMRPPLREHPAAAEPVLAPPAQPAGVPAALTLPNGAATSCWRGRACRAS